jgi:hypothetical protein
MRTRKPKLYYVTRGLLQGEGLSKTTAKADLDRQVTWACDHTGLHVEPRFGLVIAMGASPGGWEYAIIEAADIAKHGERRRHTASLGQIAFTDALNRARHHAAQWAWNRDVVDDTAFVTMAGLLPETTRELTSWIRFQRNYIAHRAAGMNDCQAFAAANGLPA